MARQKVTRKSEWRVYSDPVLRSLTTFGNMDPAQASLVEKAATMLTDQPETHERLCFEIAFHFPYYIMLREYHSTPPRAKDTKHRLDQARRHCTSLIAALGGSDLAAIVVRGELWPAMYSQIHDGADYASSDGISFDKVEDIAEAMKKVDALCEQLKVMEAVLNATRIKSKKGRPSSEHRHGLIRDLAEIFHRETGKRARANWSVDKDEYTGPFVQFVSAVQDAIGEPVKPKKLGDTINRALKKRGK